MKDDACVRFLQQTLPGAGLRWAGYRKVRRQVCKRLRRRLRALGLADLDAYAELLARDTAERAAFDALCRIPISRFYRDRGVFDRLLQGALPDLITERCAGGQGEIRCWSAGCASGEEPYTLAILWRLAFARRHADCRFTVLATDADEVLLARARAARYPPGCLRDLPAAWREAAFGEQEGDGTLHPEFRAGVRFARQDIRREMPDGPFDLILCRNLAFTYFDDAGQRRALAGLARRLRPGGVLVIGSHERLPEGATGLHPLNHASCLFRRDV